MKNQEDDFTTRLQREMDNQFSPIGRLNSLDEVPTLPGRLNVGLECLDRQLWELPPALPRLAALGIHHARLQSGWGLTETVKGIYDFSWLDKDVDALLSIGIEPWLCLCYGNYIYISPDHLGELKARLGQMIDDPAHIDEKLQLLHGIGHQPLETEEACTGWLNYVKALVTHFKGRVRTFEIWNEPDVFVFFPTKGAWTEEYVRLVSLTAPVIRAANPSAQIVGGSGGRNASMEALLRLGLGKWLDVQSFHGYHEYPEIFSFSAYRAYRTLINEYEPRLKLWRGEAGCPSANPQGSHGALCKLHASEELQARWVLRNLINDLAMRELDLTSIFHLYDFMHFSHNYQYHYGLLRHDYSPKPSFYAVQTVAKLLDAPTEPAEDLLMTPTSGPGYLQSNTVIRSFRRNGAPLFAYWLPGDYGHEAAPQRADFNVWFIGSAIFTRPVVIDLLTRKVYSVTLKDYRTASGLPVASYPMLLADASTFTNFIHFDLEVQAFTTDTSVTKQYIEA